MMKLAAILFLLLLSTLPILSISYSDIIAFYYRTNVNPSTVNETFDAVLFMELLNNALTLMANGNYMEASKIINTLSHAYVPEDLSYTHNRTLEILRKLLEILNNISITENTIEELLSKGECNLTTIYEEKLRKLIINAFSLKYKLVDEGILDNYRSSLLRSIENPNIRFSLSKGFEKSIDSLIRHFDFLRNSVVDIINKMKKCNITGTLIIEIKNADTYVLGNQPITVYGRVTDTHGSPVPNATVKLNLLIAGYSIINYTFTDEEGYFNSILLAPSSNTILKILPVLNRPYIVNSTLYVYAFKKINESIYRGLKILNVSIRYVKPRIEADCPASINYSSQLVLDLTVKTNSPLNTSILLDNSPLGNFSLLKGINNLTLTLNNTTPGLHTLVFASEAYGPYIPVRYSCTFAIVKRTPSLKVSINSIVLYPFDKLHIYASVGNVNNSSTSISIIIDDRLLYTANNSIVNVTLPAPLTYLIQYHSVDIVVYSRDEELGSFSYKILGINPLGIIVSFAVVLTGFSLGLDKYIIRLPYIFLNIKRLLSRRGILRRKEGAIAGKIRKIEKYISSRISSTVVKIYWLTVKIISRIIGSSPSPSETLREYLSRSKRFLESELYRIFEKITLLAERDLYSRNKASKREEEEAKKMLERLKKK